jgi:hypothetical protein
MPRMVDIDWLVELGIFVEAEADELWEDIDEELLDEAQFPMTGPEWMRDDLTPIDIDFKLFVDGAVRTTYPADTWED